MNKDIKKRAKHRVKIIEGQIKGLEKMIDSEKYCLDILTQSLAIQKSLASLNKLVLKNHIETHTIEMLSSENSDEQKKAISELIDLYELNNIRGS